MTAPTPFRYAVLASGGGSNFGAILRESKANASSVEAAFVASNNSQPGVRQIAADARVPFYHVSAKTEGSDEGVARRLIALLDEHRPDLLVLAGYMKKVPDAVLERMKNRVVNIHPALLPKHGGAGMYGHHVHEAVVRAGDAFSGMTIHMVNEHYDEGQVILQRQVEVDGADAQEVARRVLRLEHDTYWQVIKAFAEGRIVPTSSNDPSQAVRIDPLWKADMAQRNSGVILP